MNPGETGPSAGAPTASRGQGEPVVSEGAGGFDQPEYSPSEPEPFDGPDTGDPEPSDNEQ